MSGLHGALQSVHLSRTLVTLVVAPCVRGLLELSLGERLRRPRDRGGWVLAWTLLQLGLLSWHVQQLASGSFRGALLQSLGSVARVGALDVEVTLAMDSPSVWMLVALTALAQVAAARAARVEHRLTPSAPSASFALAGATLAILADGFAPLIVGFTLTGVAVAALGLRGVGPTIRGVVAGIGSSLALVCAAVVLFWTLGGSWGIPLGWDVEYTRRDPQPQLAADDTLRFEVAPSPVSVVHAVDVLGSEPRAPTGRAFLTMTALPGSRVFLAGSDAPAASTPFARLELPAGEVDVEIETSSGGPRLRLAHVKLVDGGEVALTPLGPTLGLRALGDQLAVIDASGAPVVGRILDARGPSRREIWGVSATGLALVFVVVAALWALAQWPLHGWLLEASEGANVSTTLVLVSLPLLGLHVLRRFQFLFALAPAATKAVIVLGGLGALLSGLSALAPNPRRRRLGYGAFALFGLAMATALSRSSAWGVCAAAAIGCLALAAHDRESSPVSDLVDRSLLARSDHLLRGALFALFRVLTVIVAFLERGLRRRLGAVSVVLAVFVGVLGVSRPAAGSEVGAPRAYGGTLVILERGPLELDAEGRAQFTLKNTSETPLLVTSLYGRTTERDPRIPGTLTASFEGGAAKGPIEPGASRVVHVAWDRSGARLSQIFAQVVVESTDAAAPQMAIGVVGHAPGPLAFVTHHVVAILVALPLLAALAALLVGVVPASARHAIVLGRGLAVGATGAQLGLAVWIVRGFDGSVGHADGNDGLQFVEHARLANGTACEWFVGVDGLSVAMIVLTVVVGFVGALVGEATGPREKAYFPLYLLLVAGLMLGFCAVDSLLFLAGSLTAFVSLALLVGLFGGAGRRRAARKLVVATTLAGGALLFGFLALARHAEPTFLADGARTLRSYAAPELSRVDFLAQGAHVLGRPLVLVAFSAIFLGSAILFALAPLHGWLADVVAEAPPAVGLVVLGLVTRLGLHGLLRFGFAILPEATRWAAPTLAILGVAQIFFGAFAALGCDGRKRTLAYLSMTHVGFALLGAASLTPQGLSGCLASASGQALSLGLAMVVVELLARRGVAHDARVGPARRLPRLSGLFALALLGSAGAPGLVGFVGEGLALFGAFPIYRALTLLAAVGFLVALAPHVALFARTFGEPDAREGEADDDRDEAATILDAGGREVAVLVPLALAIVALGLHPRPLLDAPRGTLGELGVRLNPGGVALTSPDRERPCRFPRRGPRAGCSPSSSA